VTEYLTLESLIQIAYHAVGGTPEVRDYGLLESLVSNRGLVDGNKRLGWLATATFLWINGYDVVATDDEIFRLVIGIAGRDAELDDINRITDQLVFATVARSSS
jgi:death-on-curing protein